MRKTFFVLLIINFVMVILIPLLIDLLGLPEDWSGYYAAYIIVPVFLTSLMILLVLVIIGFVKDMRGDYRKDQSE